MKRKMILLVLTLFFVVGIPNLYADNDRPWRDLPTLDDFKKMTLQYSEINDISGGEISNGSYLVGEMTGGDNALALFHVYKRNNTVIRTFLCGFTYLDAPRFKGKHYVFMFDDKKCIGAVCRVEEVDKQDKNYRIDEIDPDFIPEITEFYLKAEKIFFEKLNGPKMRGFIDSLN